MTGDPTVNNIRQFSKTRIIAIIREELNDFLAEGHGAEIEEIIMQLMKNDSSLSQENAETLAKSIIFRRRQQGTVDYSQRTGVPSESIPHLKRLGGSLDEGAQDITAAEGVPAIPRGKVQTQKQSEIERGTAAMLNDLLLRVEHLETAREDTRKLLHQILKKMGAME